jgi:hypothetical protein
VDVPKFDYKTAKEEIAQINAIVETCPDAVKEKCFELLFSAVFGTSAVPVAAALAEPPPPPKKGSDVAPVDTPAAPQTKKLPSNILVFTRKYNVSEADLERLFMLDHEPLLPIYKIPGGKMSRSQISKVLMILLENGLLNNALSAPYAELRDSVKEDGFMDTNFNQTLRRNHGLFRGAITEDAVDPNGTVELSGLGLEKLAEQIKELGQSKE